ncbi:ComF family protein [Streptomyces sp. NPDC127084]|uniref:ComF family protein n=1 Tax=Streptomyces sp. NPDC127084 TaxID=3347133 RepID=UPI003662F144
MRGWWQEIAGLVLPLACPGCGCPRTPLCEECAGELTGREPRRVRPSPEPAGLPMVFAAAGYEGAVRALLLAHKERGALGLAGLLGGALAGAVRAALAQVPGGVPGPVLLVPVPSARHAVRARGQDAARRVAAAAAGALRRGGVPARVLPVLRQCRPVADQSGLTARLRLANMAGALGVVPGAERLLVGRTAVLVDDLMTTGASLAEAARALCAAQRCDPAVPVVPAVSDRPARYGTVAAVVAAPVLAFGSSRGPARHRLAEPTRRPGRCSQ